MDILPALGSQRGFKRLHDQLRRPQDPVARRSRWDQAARLWLADQVSQWFNDDFLNSALFDGADDIRLDLLIWSCLGPAGTDRRRSRSSSFSSGQQTFAYTQARVAQLDRAEQSENRLIALDEFGSYLDAIKMGSLLSYLADNRAGPEPIRSSGHHSTVGDRAAEYGRWRRRRYAEVRDATSTGLHSGAGSIVKASRSSPREIFGVPAVLSASETSALTRDLAHIWQLTYQKTTPPASG